MEGRAGPEGLGWKAGKFDLDAEGSGEPVKVLEPLRELVRFVFGKIDQQMGGARAGGSRMGTVGCGVFFWGDENVSVLDRGSNCPTV